MKVTTYLFAKLLGASLVLSLPASANAVIGLYNTGVDNNNVPLSVIDPLIGYGDDHYTFNDSTFPDSWPPLVVAGGFDCSVSPCSYTGWLAPSSTSNWIAGSSDWDPSTGTWLTHSNADVSLPRTDTYTTTFDLTGINFASTSISGRLAASTSLIDVVINGHSTGQTWGSAIGWGSFAINSGFQSGVNTLTFEVQDTGIPAGLRVEYTNIVAPPVPEPETWAMMMAGLGMMGFMTRRRRAS